MYIKFILPFEVSQIPILICILFILMLSNSTKFAQRAEFILTMYSQVLGQIDA